MKVLCGWPKGCTSCKHGTFLQTLRWAFQGTGIRFGIVPICRDLSFFVSVEECIFIESHDAHVASISRANQAPGLVISVGEPRFPSSRSPQSLSSHTWRQMGISIVLRPALPLRIFKFGWYIEVHISAHLEGFTTDSTKVYITTCRLARLLLNTTSTQASSSTVHTGPITVYMINPIGHLPHFCKRDNMNVHLAPQTLVSLLRHTACKPNQAAHTRY